MGLEPTLLWAEMQQGCAVAAEAEISQQRAVSSPLPPQPKAALNSLLVPENQAGGGVQLRTQNLLYTFRPDNLLCLAGSHHVLSWFEVNTSEHEGLTAALLSRLSMCCRPF